MIRLARVLLFTVAVSVSVVAVAAPDDKPAVKIEFRLAEREPAAGLQEATVEGTTEKVYLHKEPGLTNEDIAEARVATEGRPVVELTFTDKGKEKVAKLTGDHQGKPIAILVDGKVIAAPTVRATIRDKAMLSVKTKEEAARIARGLQARKVPANGRRELAVRPFASRRFEHSKKCSLASNAIFRVGSVRGGPGWAVADASGSDNRSTVKLMGRAAPGTSK
jgi:hypothetical protein